MELAALLLRAPLTKTSGASLAPEHSDRNPSVFPPNAQLSRQLALTDKPRRRHLAHRSRRLLPTRALACAELTLPRPSAHPRIPRLQLRKEKPSLRAMSTSFIYAS